jgi:multidrug resistance efflux pump
MAIEEVGAPQGSRGPTRIITPHSRPAIAAPSQDTRNKLNDVHRLVEEYRAARAARLKDAEVAWAKLVQAAGLAVPQLPAAVGGDQFLPHLRPAEQAEFAPVQEPSFGRLDRMLRTSGVDAPLFRGGEERRSEAVKSGMSSAAVPTRMTVLSSAGARRSRARVSGRGRDDSAPEVALVTTMRRPTGPTGPHGRGTVQPPRAARPSRLFLAIVVVAILASVSAVGLVRSKLGRPNPVRRALNLSGTAFEGTIVPANQFNIAAAATTIIQRVVVAVGDRVEAGQPLLVGEDREGRTALDAAQLELVSVESRIAAFRRRLALLEQTPSADLARASGRVSTAQRESEQVPTRQWRDSPERAEAAHELARLKLERVQKLWDQGLVARQELDDAAIALRVAANDVENARRAARAGASLTSAQSEQSDLQWKLARAEQTQQRDAQRAELLAAMLRRDEVALQVKAATDRLARATITASSGGVVTEILAHAGDQVYGGTPLVRLAVLDPLLVEVQVTPALINALSPGEPAAVTLPGAPDEQTPGTILAVNPIPNRNGNHTVQVRFENKAGQLLTGQPAEVRFQIP